MLLSSCLPVLRRLRQKGRSRKKQRSWGALGKRTFNDQWKWPKKGYLFPNSTGTGPIKKDIVCHNICKARSSFEPPKGSVLLSKKSVRSHSGRHRMINDLKSSGVATDAAMVFARIKHKRTFDRYGRLDSDQSAKMLQSNKKLKATLKKCLHG